MEKTINQELKERIQNQIDINKEIQRKYNLSQDQIASLNFAIQQADDKIKALNTIHTDKVRNLLSSIQNLQKQILLLEKNAKDHKRSQLIEKLNKELAEQDTIIEGLRKVINNDELADKTILKIIHKGPVRLRAETREELKMQIKKLQQSFNKSQHLNQSTSYISEKSVIHQKDTKNDESQLNQSTAQTDFDEELVNQIELLKQENEELKLNYKAIQTINDKQQVEIQRKNIELNQYISIRQEKDLIQSQYENLEKQIKIIQDTQNQKIIGNFDKLVRLEELELLHKTNDDKVKSLEKTLQLEKDNIKQKMIELNQKRTDMIEQNTNLQLKIKCLKEELESQNQTINILQNNLKLKNNQMEEIQNEIQTITNEYENKINIIQKEKDYITLDNQKLNENLGQMILQQKKDEEKFSNMQKLLYLSEENKLDQGQNKGQTQISENQGLGGNNNVLLQENNELKTKLRETIINEIKLQEKLEEITLLLNIKQKNQMQKTMQASKVQVQDDVIGMRKSQKISDLDKRLQKTKKKNQELQEKLERQFSRDISQADSNNQSSIMDNSQVSELSYTIQSTNSNFDMSLKDFEAINQENQLMISNIEKKQSQIKLMESMISDKKIPYIEDKKHDRIVQKYAEQISEEEVKQLITSNNISSNFSEDNNYQQIDGKSDDSNIN